MTKIKQLTKIQYEILSELREDWFYPFRHFEFTRKELKKEFKILREAGLAEFSNGLMTEDGEVCGSGYGRNRNARDEIDKLLKDWEVKECDNNE